MYPLTPNSLGVRSGWEKELREQEGVFAPRGFPIPRKTRKQKSSRVGVDISQLKME